MVSDEVGGGVQIEVRGTSAAPVVAVSGELDLSTADTVRTALNGLAAEVQRVELDLSELRFLDSSGLAVFIELAAHCPVTIVAASHPVRRIVEVTGLDDALGLSP